MQFCENLKKEKGVTSLGMVGYTPSTLSMLVPRTDSRDRYCLGGQVTTLLSSTKLLDVIVTVHPGFLHASDFAETHQPLALICAEGALSVAGLLASSLTPETEDFSFDLIKTKVTDILNKIRAARHIPIVFYDHEGTVHGAFLCPLSFALRHC